MSQSVQVGTLWCQDPLAINCPTWCPECPNYDPDLLVDWNDQNGVPYNCRDWFEMYDPYTEWTNQTPNLGNARNCVYDNWCPQENCLDPNAHQTFKWFENKTTTEFSIGYCNNTDRHVQALQSKVYTLLGMEMEGVVLSPSLNNPLPYGKSMSVMSSVSGEGSRLTTLAIHWWPYDLLESQLILPHETFSQEQPFYTFYGSVPDHLCIVLAESVTMTWLPEPVPQPCDPEYTVQNNPMDMSFCHDGIGKGGFKGKSRVLYEETGGMDCTQPGACEYTPEAGAGVCYYMEIHPDDYPVGGYTFSEDCIAHNTSVPFIGPVCLNSTIQTQCNFCENPICPDEDCLYDYLYCCFDVDGDGMCDDNTAVNYCCGETCSDCYSGQDINGDGIDDGEQFLDLDATLPPDPGICFDGVEPVFCCPDKKPTDGVCDDSYNPNLWTLSCDMECPDKSIPIDFAIVNELIMEGIHGCNDPYAWNFHPWAFIGCESGTMSCCDYNNDGIPDNVDDGYEGVVYGCTSQYCDNYNPDATVNIGNCCGTHPLCGPTLPDDSWTWQFITECGYDCTAPDARCGCTDPSAMNYDSSAIVDDGSCRYTPGTEPSGPPPEDCLQCTSDRDCFNQFGYTDTGAMFCNMTYITPGEIGCCEERNPGTRPLPPRPIGRRQLDRLGDDRTTPTQQSEKQILINRIMRKQRSGR